MIFFLPSGFCVRTAAFPTASLLRRWSGRRGCCGQTRSPAREGEGRSIKPSQQQPTPSPNTLSSRSFFAPGRLPHLQLCVPLLRLQLQPSGLPEQAPRLTVEGQDSQGGGAHNQLRIVNSGSNFLDYVTIIYSYLILAGIEGLDKKTN